MSHADEVSMALLKDDELVPLVTGANPIVTDLPMPPALPAPPAGAAPDPWYGSKSPVQASSVDLHIGAILLPGVDEDDPGSVTKPQTDLALKFGHTVVITTQEQLNLPNSIAAFGFPPAHLSFRGLLMTNPGHVDPGYAGPMRFTVMNVGKEDITFAQATPSLPCCSSD
jgi:dUTPase